MKKSTLALSIAAALGGMGMAGNALAVVGYVAPVVNTNNVTATVLERNDNGAGHQLLFPYFTAQGDNATMIAITNTDTVNGKLVKVRFRGAANSDDLFDFQLALSPGDVWTAAVTKDAATGLAKLSTSDTSCTIPYRTDLNGAKFNTFRVDPSAADIAGQTREGYIEVINMANIAPKEAGATNSTANALFTAIKHKAATKTPDCTADVLEARLGSDGPYASLTSSVVGLSNPTTGLTGDWIIMNQTSVASWSGSATALEARVAASGAAGAGALVFWPQTAVTPTDVTGTAGTSGYATSVGRLTADPLMTSGVLPVLNFDLPDLSTPYVASTADANAGGRADATTAQLAVKSIANQYVTTPGINAVTDLLFSQPLRRYSAAVNYKAFSTTNSLGVTTLYPFNTTGAIAAPIYRGSYGTSVDSPTDTTATDVYGPGSDYYGATNLAIPTGGRNLCLNNVSISKIYDREETTPAAGTSSAGFVISPNPAPTTPNAVPVCGEAAVVTMNSTGTSALSASIAVSAIKSSDLSSYTEGWVLFNIAGNTPGYGLPILGSSFIRANNGNNNYGFTWSHKVTR